MADIKRVAKKTFKRFLNTGTPSGDLKQRLNPCEIIRFCRQTVGKFSMTVFGPLVGLEAVFFVGGVSEGS